MPTAAMFRYALLHLLAATLVSGHILITYPGSRGNNFITNETWPFGMQWNYPCGGLSLSKNRTYWPTAGGTLAFQPGWFSGHQTAFLYVNLGLDADGPDGGPLEYPHVLASPWQLLGPSNGPFPGTLCLPDVKVPADLGVKAGDKATIQIVELATHGASLFACSDIEFVDDGDDRLPPLNDSVCFNTTEFGFADIHSHVSKKGLVKDDDDSGVGALLSPVAMMGWVPALVGGLWFLL